MDIVSSLTLRPPSITSDKHAAVAMRTWTCRIEPDPKMMLAACTSASIRTGRRSVKLLTIARPRDMLILAACQK
jgi:hypothetical protein